MTASTPSVQAASEALSRCIGVDETLDGLGQLQLALRETDDATRYYYDPSDVFSVIESVSVHARNHLAEESTTSPPSLEGTGLTAYMIHPMVHSISEKSLETAVILAEVCVAPTWWRQLHIRHTVLRDLQVTNEPGEGKTFEGESTRRRLTTYERTTQPGDSSVASHSVIIPEELPPKMIRLAAGVECASTSVADLQAKIVVALCCHPLTLAQMSSRDYYVAKPNVDSLSSWPICGIHDVVSSMVVSWLDLGVKLGDDANNERVAQIISILLVSGWHPSTGEMAVYLVKALTNTLRRCKVENESEGESSYDVARQPAIEACSAIALLGSYGHIPDELFHSVIVVLCQIHGGAIRKVAAPLHLPPSTCAASAILAMVSCDLPAARTINSLLAIKEVFASSLTGSGTLDQQTRGDEVGIVEAYNTISAADEIMIYAMWAQDCLVDRARLRIYWSDFLGSTSRVVRAALISLQEEVALVHQRRLALELAIARSARALSMIVKGIRVAELNLSSVEWDTFSICLQQAIDLAAMEALRLEAGTTSAIHDLIVDIGDFLDVWQRCEVVPFTDYPLQAKMYGMLLSVAHPILRRDELTALGIVVVRCWSTFGLSPHRLEGWKDTMSTMLDCVFQTNGNVEYMHTQSVRLEACKLLTFRDIEEETNENIDAHHPILGEAKTGTSVLAYTEYMREHYLELVDSLIMPLLTRILVGDSLHKISGSSAFVEDGMIVEDGSAYDGSLSVSSVARHLAVPFYSLDPKEEEPLALWAVALVGRLGCCSSGELSHHAQCISLLQSVSVNRYLGLDHTRVGGASAKLSHSHSLRFVAIGELERCLLAPFASHPHSHATTLATIEALCSVLDFYTAELQTTRCSRVAAVLAMRALDPLTRFRVSIDLHAVFRRRGMYYGNAEDLLSVVLADTQQSKSPNRYPVAETRGAAFLVLENEGLIHASTPNCTTISFAPVASSMLSFLTTSKNVSGKASSCVRFCLSRLRAACYNSLRAMALMNVKIDIPVAAAHSVFERTKCDDIIEVHARHSALGQIVEMAFVGARNYNGACSLKGSMCDRVLGWLLALVEFAALDDSCMLDDEPIDTACKTLCSIIPFLCDPNSPGELFSSTCGTLARVFVAVLDKERGSGIVGCDSPRRSETRRMGLLHALYDMLVVQSVADLTKDLRVSALIFCYEIVSQRDSQVDAYTAHLALRCFAILVDTIQSDELDPITQANARLLVQGQRGLLSKVASDVLRRRVRFLEATNQIEGRPLPILPDAKKHDILVSETENIDNFRATECAAWLCGEDILLTCRIGNKEPRFSGWAEIVMRTLSSRDRVLVRIPGKVSSAEPDLPTPVFQGAANPERNTVSVPKRVTGVHIDAAAAQLARGRALLQSAPLQNQQDVLAPRAVDLEHSPTVLEPSGPLSPSQWLGSVLGHDKDCTSSVLKKIDEILLLHDVEGTPDSPGTPRQLALGDNLDRAIAILDRTAVLNTHKIALLYDKSASLRNDGGNSEQRFLSTSCSSAFYKFAERLGSVVPTRRLRLYSGGLDTSEYEADGKYALIWLDEDPTKSNASTAMVVFHLFSFLPDSQLNRKRHAGNDTVLILFSDRGSDAIVEFDLAGRDFNKSIIGGSYGFVAIFVTLPKPSFVRVSLRVRSMKGLISSTLERLECDTLVAEQDAPAYVRNLAMRADLACRSILEVADPPSNCLRRFELLQEMKRHLL